MASNSAFFWLRSKKASQVFKLGERFFHSRQKLGLVDAGLRFFFSHFFLFTVFLVAARIRNIAVKVKLTKGRISPALV